MQYLVPAQDAEMLSDSADIFTFDRPKRSVSAVRSMLRAFFRQLRQTDPDVVFFHSSLSLICLAAMRTRGDKRPVIYCPHGWAGTTYDHAPRVSWAVRKVEARLAGLADLIICVSQHERSFAKDQNYKGTFKIIETGVPEAAADARDDLFDPEKLNLLFVGRLDRQKGFDLLLEALQDVDRPDLHVHVVGAAVRGGEAFDDLPQNVRMIGWVPPDGVDDWYRSADALVVPSRWEAFGLVIPEALRNETPVFCSDRGGMRDLVEPGVTGDVFPLDGGALVQLLQNFDKDDLRRMRPACRQSYERRFSREGWLKELAQSIREITSTP